MACLLGEPTLSLTSRVRGIKDKGLCVPALSPDSKRHGAGKQQRDATGLRDRYATCNSETDIGVHFLRVGAAVVGGVGSQGEGVVVPRPATQPPPRRGDGGLVPLPNVASHVICAVGAGRVRK